MRTSSFRSLGRPYSSGMEQAPTDSGIIGQLLNVVFAVLPQQVQERLFWY